MRLLEIILSETATESCKNLMEDEKVVEHWTNKTSDGNVILKYLIQDEDAKGIMQKLERSGNFRVIIYPIEGTLPKVREESKKTDQIITVGKFVTASKEELYEDIEKPSILTINFIFMVILSSFVAGIGILRDNQAIIIGAMVIAPFLGPNISAAFGTTLGDLRIIQKSLVTGLVATIIALIISVLWGYFAGDLSAVTRDGYISYQDFLLALVCGFAGIISAISGQSTTLVGVMVAAALLPPLMRAGLFLGGGIYTDAVNSFLIFSANIICLNIAGIATFYFAGIKPSKWWEKEKAAKKTRIAIVFWLLALIILSTIMILMRYYGYLE